ncbi:MAG TPA: DEAD/DEAH box helicase [Cytophagales bacterium]|nr:DEAD/DEAH box helicase [Cytophagales bacterium]
MHLIKTAPTLATFAELGIKEAFIKALQENNIETPSEIQKKVIPVVLRAKTDLIAQAQTGTGKTAAFGLPLLQSVDPNNAQIQALVLAPTRELCQQIAKQLFKFTKHGEKIFTTAVFGGANIDEQVRSLQRPTQILVATPGRLIDLLERKALVLTHIQTIVLDEADEMLSMGFKKELDTILQQTNGHRNTWLFSATMPKGIKEIIDSYMAPHAPNISIDSKNIVNKDIEHLFVLCEDPAKLKTLLSFLTSQGSSRGVIFCRTKSGAHTLAQQLKSKNIAAEAIHGDLMQKERDKVMRAFKNESLQILIATDLAARGIDVEGLSYVVHYNLPDQLEYYTHRSGRTARAGKKGISLIFANSKEVPRIKEIEKALHISIQRVKD